MPFVPGSEFSGVISHAGDGVDPARIGQRVCATAFGAAFGESAVVPAKLALPLPPTMSFDEGAIFQVSYGTAYHALVQRGNLRSGETLLVLGAGGAVGYAAVEIGKALGATVIASASSAEKRSLAKGGGADHAIDARATDWRDRVKAANRGRPVDVVLDPVGGAATETAFRSLAWGGRHLVIGFAGGDIPRLPTNLALLKGAALLGVDIRQLGIYEPAVAQANMAGLFALYERGALNPPVARRYSLDRFAEAMEDAAAGSTAGRIVLQMRTGD